MLSFHGQPACSWKWPSLTTMSLPEWATAVPAPNLRTRPPSSNSSAVAQRSPYRHEPRLIFRSPLLPTFTSPSPVGPLPMKDRAWFRQTSRSGSGPRPCPPTVILRIGSCISGSHRNPSIGARTSRRRRPMATLCGEKRTLLSRWRACHVPSYRRSGVPIFPTAATAGEVDDQGDIPGVRRTVLKRRLTRRCRRRRYHARPGPHPAIKPSKSHFGPVP